MTKVAVLGAGVMGTGVAHNYAQYGFRVVLVDVNPAQLEMAQKNIARNLRLYSLYPDHHRSSEPVVDIMSRIEFTENLGRVADADLIVENVTEEWQIKKTVYDELASIARTDAVVGVNTSAISITRVAALLPRPERVVGVHFMNPVPLKPMVEMIRAYHTADEAIEAFQETFRRMNKSAIVVNDSPGFVTNRAMMIFVNEAAFMVSEGVATPAEVDMLFKECFGHKMGPLETADLIGIDTILASLISLHEGFNDDKFRPCFLLKKMTSAGLLGMKSGHGFYNYS
jgi:3-hydroxybutyryl-CoA dehydrogenase